MTTILIADSSKPSLVMTSEIFKDKIPGAVVHVANNGTEALEKMSLFPPDMIVVDFDLPDVDGASLVEAIRKSFRGPVLMTAFPDSIVSKAVDDMLFTYNDASGYLQKPIKFDELAKKIDKFLIERHRLGRRFDTEVPTQLVGKAAGRGKRAPKVTGRIVNISLGGACVELDSNQGKVKKAQEFILTLPMFDEKPTKAIPGATKKAATKTTAAKKATAQKKKAVGPETKVKATVAWVNPQGQIGLQFGKLTELQKKELETILRAAS